LPRFGCIQAIAPIKAITSVLTVGDMVVLKSGVNDLAEC
jgi:hypothetical protein